MNMDIRRILFLGFGTVLGIILTLPLISYPTYRTKYEVTGHIVHAIIVSVLFIYFLIRSIRIYKNRTKNTSTVLLLILIIFFGLFNFILLQWAWSGVLNRV